LIALYASHNIRAKLSPHAYYRNRAEYISRMQVLRPDDIQLNTPTRPQPLTHQLEARGNHLPTNHSYPTRQLKRVKAQELKAFSDRLERELGIPMRYPFQKSAADN